MRRYFSFLILLVLVVSLGSILSCISLKVKPLFPTENKVEYIHLCKGINDSSDLLKPVDIQSEFTLKDDKVICFIQLKDIAEKVQLRWKWYSPEKEMFRDTGNVIVNQDERYLEVVTAYDMLKLDPEDSIEGQWTVVFFINNKFIEKKTFRVSLSKKLK